MHSCPKLEHKFIYRDIKDIDCDMCNKSKPNVHSWFDEGCSMVCCLECKAKGNFFIYFYQRIL